MAIICAEKHITLSQTLGASLALPAFHFGAMRRAWARKCFCGWLAWRKPRRWIACRWTSPWD